ncbi:hypothetical protein IMX07_15900 [bacterium]|nr:hypothetical protein [bacterium]
MANDTLAGIGEAIRKAAAAYADALSAVGKALQDVAGSAAGADRDRLVENWLRVARMSKDGVITALEQGFELWEREIRRTAALARSAGGERPSNPADVWAENWRRATEAFGNVGGWGDEARKQAEAVQKTLQDGLRAWQRLWEPDKK